MITTRPLGKQNCWLLPLCRTGSSCSPLMAALFQRFSGEALEDGRWTQHRIAKVRPAGSWRPDCPMITVWPWAELLGMAGGGSTHEQDYVCVDGYLKEVEGKREGETKALAGHFIASAAPCCLLHLPYSASALGPLEKARSYKSKTMGRWTSSHQLRSHSQPCSQWAPAPSCPTSQTWPI